MAQLRNRYLSPIFYSPVYPHHANVMEPLSSPKPVPKYELSRSKAILYVLRND